MSCDRCGVPVADPALHATYHAAHQVTGDHDPGASGGFYTCDRCFAIVAENGREGHAWWHAGLIEMMLLADRLERSSRATESPGSMAGPAPARD